MKSAASQGKTLDVLRDPSSKSPKGHVQWVVAGRRRLEIQAAKICKVAGLETDLQTLGGLGM